MLFKKVGLISVFFLVAHFSSAQNDLDAISKSELKSYNVERLYKKSLLTEGYDVVYQRLELNINLKMKWVYGKVTTAFKPLKPAFNLLQFDFTDSLKVDSVTFKNKKVVG